MKPEKPTQPENQLYQYQAKVLSVYDADTATLDIDLGFEIRHTITVRLLGINAPEMKGAEKEAGTLARDVLRSKILGKEVVAHTVKDRKEKYGRYLAAIYLDGINVNDWLVEYGYAKYQQY